MSEPQNGCEKVSNLTDADLNFRIDQIWRNRTKEELAGHKQYQAYLAELQARQQCGVAKSKSGLEYRV